jgi:hypothetical protein
MAVSRNPVGVLQRLLYGIQILKLDSAEPSDDKVGQVNISQLSRYYCIPIVVIATSPISIVPL